MATAAEVAIKSAETSSLYEKIPSIEDVHVSTERQLNDNVTNLTEGSLTKKGFVATQSTEEDAFFTEAMPTKENIVEPPDEIVVSTNEPSLKEKNETNTVPREKQLNDKVTMEPTKASAVYGYINSKEVAVIESVETKNVSTKQIDNKYISTELSEEGAISVEPQMVKFGESSLEGESISNDVKIPEEETHLPYANETISSTSHSLIEDDDTSALMKLAELACRNEIICIDDSVNVNSESMEVDKDALVCYKDRLGTEPRPAELSIDHQDKIEKLTPKSETLMPIKLNKTELTNEVKLTVKEMENNSLTDDIQNLKDNKSFTKNNTLIDLDEELLLTDYVCKNCEKIWGNEILRLLFEGTEPVTVNSRITYGAILCMTAYASKNKLSVDDSVKTVLDSADCVQKVGSLSQSVHTICNWIRKLITFKRIKCCDPYFPLHSCSKPEKIFNKSKSIKSKSIEVNVITDNVNISSLRKVTKENDYKTKSPYINCRWYNRDILETPNDSPHKLYKMVGQFTSNVKYLKSGKLLPVKYYLSNERLGLPKAFRNAYNYLYCNDKYFSEIDGTCLRQISCYELILCCVTCFNPYEGKYNKKLLYGLVTNILQFRGKSLLIPDEETLYEYIIKLATELLSLDNTSDELWDENEIYSVTISHQELEFITVRDVIFNFCYARNGMKIAHYKKNLCDRLKLLNVDDVIGYSLRVYAIYCDLAFIKWEESKARFLLNLNIHSNQGGCIVTAELELFPPKSSSCLDTYIKYYQQKLSFNFNYESLSKENQDIILEETLKCKQDIVKLLKDETMEKFALATLEENSRKVGTKRKIRDEFEFGKCIKSIKGEKSSSKNLLKDVITNLLQDSIIPDDLPCIVGIIYREIYKIEPPLLSDIKEVVHTC